MYLRIVSAFCVSLLVSHVNGEKLPQLFTELEGSVHDTTKCRLYCDIAYEYRNINNDSALHFLELALPLAEAAKDTALLGTVYQRKGVACKYLGRYDEAIEYYKNARTYWQAINYEYGLARNHLDFGNLYIKWGDIDYRNGSGQKSESKYLIARSYYEKALTLGKKIGAKDVISKSYNNLSTVCYYLEDYEQALELMDQAFAFAEEAGLPKEASDALMSKAAIQEALGSFEGVLKTYQNCLKTAIAAGDNDGMANALYYIAGTLFSLERYSESLEQYIAADSIAKLQGNNDLRIEINSDAAESYLRLGRRDSALLFLLLADSLSDQKQSLTYDSLLLAVNAEFQVEEKDKQNLKLQEDIGVQQENINMLWITMSFVVLLSGVVIYFLRQRHKSKLQLQQKESELQATNALIDGQETERKRIARELHDSLGSLLSATKLQLEAVETKVDRAGWVQRHEFEKANDLLSEAVHEVRRISHNMISSVLVNFGLVDALNDLATSMENAKGLSISVLAIGFEERERPDPKIELSTYRIVQELLQNIIKHANARNVSIRAQLDENELKLVVKDDGIGFNTDNLEKVSGIGLRNISTRVEYLKGALTLESKPGEGAKVIVKFPLVLEE